MEQPPQGQDPTTPDPTPAAAPPAPADGPWSADLATFQDPAVRQQVDQLLRTRVQPHVTQLEQQVAASRDAQVLWTDLNADPLGTYVAITQELLGDAAAEAARAQIHQLQNPTPEPAAAPAPQYSQPQEVPAPPPDPRLDEMYNHFEQQRVEKLYNDETERVKVQYPDVDTDARLYHMSVSSAGGDFDQAVVLYRDALQQMGVAPQPPTAPPAMGSDTGGGSVPPSNPAGETLNDAIDSVFREMRANEAPPVM